MIDGLKRALPAGDGNMPATQPPKVLRPFAVGMRFFRDPSTARMQQRCQARMPSCTTGAPSECRISISNRYVATAWRDRNSRQARMPPAGFHGSQGLRTPHARRRHRHASTDRMRAPEERPRWICSRRLRRSWTRRAPHGYSPLRQRQNRDRRMRPRPTPFLFPTPP